ncbi:hypothetical protein GCM10009839_31590 [Catenulispora yoronensis]|uniref:Uncharacterized protein n=1 Tax=Catenulispora yoronensis TaxID=450799 RepID=A0ABN2U5S9_9ACTN
MSKLSRHPASPGRAFSARAQPAGRRRVAHAADDGLSRSGGGVPTFDGGSGVWVLTVTGGPGFAAAGAEPPVQPYPMANTPAASTAEPATDFQRAVLPAVATEGGLSIGIRSRQGVANGGTQ